MVRALRLHWSPVKLHSNHSDEWGLALLIDQKQNKRKKNKKTRFLALLACFIGFLCRWYMKIMKNYTQKLQWSPGEITLKPQWCIEDFHYSVDQRCDIWRSWKTTLIRRLHWNHSDALRTFITHRSKKTKTKVPNVFSCNCTLYRILV